MKPLSRRESRTIPNPMVRSGESSIRQGMTGASRPSRYYNTSIWPERIEFINETMTANSTRSYKLAPPTAAKSGSCAPSEMTRRTGAKIIPAWRTKPSTTPLDDAGAQQHSEATATLPLFHRPDDGMDQPCGKVNWRSGHPNPRAVPIAVPILSFEAYAGERLRDLVGIRSLRRKSACYAKIRCLRVHTRAGPRQMSAFFDEVLAEL